MWSRKRRPEAARRRSGGEAAPATEADVGTAAMALLARRDHCTGELRSKLCERGYEEALVGVVLADLAERRLVNDARYVESYVHHHAERGQGPRRIRQDLARFDLDAELIEAAMAEHDWQRLARELRARKFGAVLPADWSGKAKQARFLQYRGFSADHIRSALGPDLDLDD
jgi:regulatory protein